MNTRLIALIVFSAILPAADSARAGGWTRKQGEGYYKMEARVLRATRLYDVDGALIPIPTYGEYTGTFYGEFGLIDRLTLIAQLPFFKRLTLNRQVGRASGIEYSPAISHNGIGDAELGVRYGLLQEGPTVLAGSLLLGLPTGTARQSGGLNTGDGEFNALVSVEGGHSFYPLPLYATLALGYNSRSNGYSNEIRWAAELGGSVPGGLQASVRMHAVAPLESSRADYPTRPDGTGNNQRYIAYGPTIGYNITKAIVVSATIESAFGARNVPAAPAWSLGIALVR